MAAARPALVDAHMHLWDLEALSYPWLTPPFSDAGVAGSVEAIARTYTLDDYCADAVGWPLEGAVHVEAGADPAHALAETRWMQTVADAAPFPMALIAYTPLNDPDVDALLAAHAESPAVRGVRQILNWHADTRKSYTPHDLLVDDEAFARGYARLAIHRLSFDLQIYPSQMAAAAALAARHPDVPVVLNHAGMPVDRDAEGRALWRTGIRALAAIPHVWVKLSGFGIVDHGWDTKSIGSQVAEIIDVFGIDRVMVASDFPTDKLYAPFDRVLGALDQITGYLTDDERRRLFNANARRAYRLAPHEGCKA